MESLARPLILTGLILVVLGLVLYVGPAVPLLGKLPGDIRIERDGTRIFIPITSCLLLSLLVSGALWVFGRFR